jgi:hypothetical protein
VVAGCDQVDKMYRPVLLVVGDAVHCRHQVPVGDGGPDESDQRRRVEAVRPVGAQVRDGCQRVVHQLGEDCVTPGGRVGPGQLGGAR